MRTHAEITKKIKKKTRRQKTGCKRKVKSQGFVKENPIVCFLSSLYEWLAGRVEVRMAIEHEKGSIRYTYYYEGA